MNGLPWGTIPQWVIAVVLLVYVIHVWQPMREALYMAIVTLYSLAFAAFVVAFVSAYWR